MKKIRRALTITLAIATLFTSAVFANTEIGNENVEKNEYKTEVSKKGNRPEISDELKEAVEEMKEAGSTREEIREYLESQGVEFKKANNRPELSDELKEVVEEMKEAGSTREEIREYLESEGVEFKNQQQ